MCIQINRTWFHISLILLSKKKYKNLLSRWDVCNAEEILTFCEREPKRQHPMHLLCTPERCLDDKDSQNRSPGSCTGSQWVAKMACHLLNRYGNQVMHSFLKQKQHDSHCTPVERAMRWLWVVFERVGDVYLGIELVCICTSLLRTAWWTACLTRQKLCQEHNNQTSIKYWFGLVSNQRPTFKKNWRRSHLSRFHEFFSISAMSWNEGESYWVHLSNVFNGLGFSSFVFFTLTVCCVIATGIILMYPVNVLYVVYLCHNIAEPNIDILLANPTCRGSMVFGLPLLFVQSFASGSHLQKKSRKLKTWGHI